jgi:hypothetical protein
MKKKLLIQSGRLLPHEAIADESGRVLPRDTNSHLSTVNNSTSRDACKLYLKFCTRDWAWFSWQNFPTF